jgi:2-oxoacid:acceptor oxidoreductase delta subunit (pyruvate/2-ketoisovalerate family)
VIIQDCELKLTRRYGEASLPKQDRLRESVSVKQGFTGEVSLDEAQRCLGNNNCGSCELCRLLCPDLCITRSEVAGKIEIDYDYCKGCGICAVVCPKGAITMELED